MDAAADVLNITAAAADAAVDSEAAATGSSGSLSCAAAAVTAAAGSAANPAPEKGSPSRDPFFAQKTYSKRQNNLSLTIPPPGDAHDFVRKMLRFTQPKSAQVNDKNKNFCRSL